MEHPSGTFTRIRSSSRIDLLRRIVDVSAQLLACSRGSTARGFKAVTSYISSGVPLVPETLEFDPSAMDTREVHHLLTALVVPRPIAWISTVDAAGVFNLAPHSYFNLVSSEPPILQFVSTGMKDTLRNVLETGEFVVSVVPEELVHEMVATGANVSADVDEFSFAGLVHIPSTRVRPPRVGGAPAALECRRRRIVKMGDAVVVFGDVLNIVVDRGIWAGDRIDPERLKAVARLGGTAYTSVDHVFHVRPTVL